MKQQDDLGLSGSDLNFLKSAIDESAIVAITDKRGVITYVNNKFCSISKYSRQELIGQTHRLINSSFHSPQFFEDMWTTISNGKVWEGNIRNRAKDGTHYWVHTSIVPFMDESGQPIKYVAVRYDITEQKLAQEKLQIYTKKLEISNRELQDFAFVAAHDLQEPLRKIHTFSDRVKAKSQDDLCAEASDYLERIQSAAQRMKILINDLLAYSRVTTQGKPFVMVDLNKVISGVKTDLELRIEQTNAKIEYDNLPLIEGDAVQLQQLFLNLIGNAIKFAKAGLPPVVKITSKQVQAEFLGRRGPACEISIADNGIGFDEKYLDRIFTIFQRLHGRHEYEGTGIGLAVCRKIVDRHGGYLTAKSKVGEGATFVLTLPTEHNEVSDLW